MEHAHHFLSRLDRVSLPHVELALSLYNDVPLLRAVLDRARVPEGAARVALSLDDSARGPFVVVTREGYFVTCLGEGMSPGALPVVPRARLDDVAAHVHELRARMATAQEVTERSGGAARLLRRIFTAGSELSREEFVALSALQPMLVPMLFHQLVSAVKDLERARVTLERITQPRPRDEAFLEAFWRRGWALGHLSLLLTLGGREFTDWLARMPPPPMELESYLSWGAVRQGILGVTLRGAWGVGRVGKPLLAGYKRRFAGADNLLTELDAGLGLAAIGLRHARLRAEVHKAMGTAPPGGDPSLADRARFGIPYETLADAVFDKPDVLTAAACTIGRAHWVALSRQKEPGMPYRFERPEEVPEPLALALVARTENGVLNTDYGLHALLSVLPWAVRARPEDLYLPREALAAVHLPWSPARTMHWRKVQLGSYVKRPVTVEKTPGRNEPCSCGSERKFKRCCGG